MGSYSGTSEIVEAKEELNTGQITGVDQLNSVFSVADKNQKLPVLKLGCKNNIDNEINKLFESIHLKTSSRDVGILQNGSSPMMKNALKKPITGGVSQSLRVGTFDPVSLKQALKDIRISKASEMAAMKRLPKLSASPRVSEVDKIKTLYNSIVAEISQPEPSFIERKENRIEIAVVPEESKSTSMDRASHYNQAVTITSSSSFVHSPPSIAITTTQNDTGTAPIRSALAYSSSKAGVQSRKLGPGQTEKQTSVPSPPLPNSNSSKLEFPKNASASKKLRKKAFVPKSERKGKGAVLVIRNKNLYKKKLKQDSGSTVSAPTSNVMNNKLVPGSTQLVCERCRCALENTSQVNSKKSIELESTSPGDEVSLSNLNSGANKPALNSSSCNISRSVAKVKKSARLKEQLEFSQSSESSQGEYSSSTCTSDESNASGSSCGIRPHMSKDVRWEAIHDAQMRHGVLSLRHFNLLKKLGCGDIGTVYLAELDGTNFLFAIKVMDNEFLARRKKMPRAQTEREILRILDHPFLPTLYAQFTSDNLSCLVMEYCPGGDLHVLRQKQLGRSFSETAARFYVAEVLLALEYLHMLGIVYRDLKPENILVREDGHIMLTDFDLSLRCAVRPMLLKSSLDVDPARISGPHAQSSCIEPFCIEPSCQVSCFSPRILPDAAKARKLKANLAARIRSLPQLVVEPTDARSNSFVGTHEYLAPEIIKGEGHGAAVDWWTFGVFLYELLYGRTPFKGSNNEETLANVVLQSLRFPENPYVSFQARDLIRGLLVKDPENRLGSEKGAAEIKQHPFFEGLNWALIRCSVPPELPEFSDFGSSDTTSQGKGKYFQSDATGEYVEFELF